MDQLRILLFSQSAAVVDEIVPELSRLMPASRIQRAAGSRDTATELERDEITASIVCVRGAEDEAWVTSLLPYLQKRNARIPIFAITLKEDAHLQLRLLELGASGCASTASELSGLIALLLDVLEQHDGDDARPFREADISRIPPHQRRCRSGLDEPPAPTDKPPAGFRPANVRSGPK